MSRILNRQVSAAFLLAGTAIGSGMISLPMVLAKWGLMGTFWVMVAFASFTFLTALIRADLNLNTRSEASLRDVGEALGVPWAGRIGDSMLQLLSFALLAAYLSAGSSVLHEALRSTVPLTVVTLALACALAGIFLLASEALVTVNKGLFIGLFTLLFLLIGFLFWQVPITTRPRLESMPRLKEWATLVPVLFTAFGFQGSIHSVTKFCQNDRNVVKKACFWGSVITALVYTAWTVAILLVTANTDTAFFQRMVQGQATDVGELVRILSHAASSSWLQKGIWCVSGLAMVTSILGVGVALLDHFRRTNLSKGAASVVTVAIPTAIVLLTPHAFIRILNVSGIILAVMAILVPCFLALKLSKRRTFVRPLLVPYQSVLVAVFLCGGGICLLGLLDMLN